MKLVYLADIRFPMERANGIQTIETCHALARRGVEVDLVVRRTDARTDAECLAYCGLEPHPSLRLRRVRARGRLGFLLHAVPLMIASEAGDVLYTRDLILADLATKLADAAVVYEAHTVATVFVEERGRMYEDGAPPTPRKLARLDARERRVFQSATGIVTITAALLDALETRHGAAANALIASDGCHVNDTMPPSSPGSKVMYVGQLYPWKGVDVLVRAMQDVPRGELTVVGGLAPEPDLERVKRLAAELGLEERVHFRGFVPPPELDAEKRQASVFVIPNLDSMTARLFTSPLKLFEAMACGRPIVASDLPSICEVLEDGANALLAPPGDAKALAGAITKLLSEPELAQRLASRAFEDVKAYSWDRRAEHIEKFLLGFALT